MVFLLAMLVASGPALAQCRVYEAPEKSQYAGQRIEISETSIFFLNEAGGLVGYYAEGVARMRCSDDTPYGFLCYGPIDTHVPTIVVYEIGNSGVAMKFNDEEIAWPAACENTQ